LSSNSEETDFIPSILYDQIMRWMPIVSVEAVIVMEGSLLFLKRENEPAMGQWWFAGGRIRKGESFEETLHREVKEETDLQISDYKFINVYSRVFPERHDITIAYLCKCKKGKVTLNNEHSEYKLLKSIPVDLHPYLLETIQDSQWDKCEAAEENKLS
jgi:ADP-ribose pyrophosphatase YjhB (NUDIX family)